MVQNIVVPPFQPLCVTAGSLHWFLHVPLMQPCTNLLWVDWVTESQQVWGLNFNWSTGTSFHTNHCSAAILKQWWKLDWRKTVSLFQRRQRLTGSSCWCCSLGGPDCKLWYRHYVMWTTWRSSRLKSSGCFSPQNTHTTCYLTTRWRHIWFLIIWCAITGVLIMKRLYLMRVATTKPVAETVLSEIQDSKCLMSYAQ